MSDNYDYSKTTFSKGIVCYNTNNHAYCVVIDGAQGSENDRGSLVMEFHGENGYILHSPPNRALVPTGKVMNLEFLAKAMRQYVAMKNQ